MEWCSMIRSAPLPHAGEGLMALRSMIGSDPLPPAGEGRVRVNVSFNLKPAAALRLPSSPRLPP